MDAILPQVFSDLRDPVPFSGKPPCLPRACLCAGAPCSPPQGSAHSGAQASAMLLCWAVLPSEAGAEDTSGPRTLSKGPEQTPVKHPLPVRGLLPLL